MIAPSFGPGSLARHAALGARGAASTVRVARRRSLELDVDTPGDLAALRDALAALPAAAPRTRALLARARLVGRRVSGRARRGRCPGCRRSGRATTSRRCSLQAAARLGDGGLRAGDVLVVAHKAVAKAEGRVVRLADVEPGARARALARRARQGPAARGADPRPRACELVRADAGRLICRTHHGFVCANAGVDQSNAGGDRARRAAAAATPTAPRARLRARLGCAVVVADSFGRAWRVGQAEVAIGCAGLRPLDDWRGRAGRAGRELHATQIAVADEAAAAADLVRGKDTGEPAVRLRGLERHVLDDDGPGAAALLRAGPTSATSLQCCSALSTLQA